MDAPIRSDAAMDLASVAVQICSHLRRAKIWSQAKGEPLTIGAREIR
jgi:hypothetical protein